MWGGGKLQIIIIYNLVITIKIALQGAMHWLLFVICSGTNILIRRTPNIIQ